jgi:hypothetical protein
MLHDEFISQAMMNFLKWCVIEAKAVAYPERSALDDVQGWKRGATRYRELRGSILLRIYGLRSPALVGIDNNQLLQHMMLNDCGRIPPRPSEHLIEVERCTFLECHDQTQSDRAK